MSAGNIVPWTDPGGTPCCCDACSSDQVANIGTTITKYTRIDLSAEDYATLRAGLPLEYSMTIVPTGNTPSNVPIASYIGTTLLSTISFPVFNGVRTCRGVGSNNIPGTGGVTTFGSVFNITGANNVTWTFVLRYNFSLVLQAAGQGAAGDAPLAQPAMYLYGTVGALTRTLPTHEIIFDFDEDGDTISTVFEQPLKASKTLTGGLIDGDITVSIGFPAP